jgi:pilus assembly protein Flp/PilA
MQSFAELFERIVREDEGQDMVEYALILGLVSVIAVVAVTATGASVSAIWSKVSTAVSKAAAAVPAG